MVIKTQIQLPDDLYRSLKRVAAEKEWSLAETLRRGAEQLLQQFPEPPPGAPPRVPQTWLPPSSQTCGWRGLSAEQLKEALRQDVEPRLPAS